MTELHSSHEPLAERRLLKSKQSCGLWRLDGCWHVFPATSPDDKSCAIPESRLSQWHRSDGLSCFPQPCISNEPSNTFQESKRRWSSHIAAASAGRHPWVAIANSCTRAFPRI